MLSSASAAPTRRKHSDDSDATATATRGGTASVWGAPRKAKRTKLDPEDDTGGESKFDAAGGVRDLADETLAQRLLAASVTPSGLAAASSAVAQSRSVGVLLPWELFCAGVGASGPDAADADLKALRVAVRDHYSPGSRLPLSTASRAKWCGCLRCHSLFYTAGKLAKRGWSNALWQPPTASAAGTAGYCPVCTGLCCCEPKGGCDQAAHPGMLCCAVLNARNRARQSREKHRRAKLEAAAAAGSTGSAGAAPASRTGDTTMAKNSGGRAGGGASNRAGSRASAGRRSSSTDSMGAATTASPSSESVSGASSGSLSPVSDHTSHTVMASDAPVYSTSSDASSAGSMSGSVDGDHGSSSGASAAGSGGGATDTASEVTSEFDEYDFDELQGHVLGLLDDQGDDRRMLGDLRAAVDAGVPRGGPPSHRRDSPSTVLGFDTSMLFVGDGGIDSDMTGAGAGAGAGVGDAGAGDLISAELDKLMGGGLLPALPTTPVAPAPLAASSGAGTGAGFGSGAGAGAGAGAGSRARVKSGPLSATPEAAIVVPRPVSAAASTQPPECLVFRYDAGGGVRYQVGHPAEVTLVGKSCAVYNGLAQMVLAQNAPAGAAPAGVTSIDAYAGGLESGIGAAGGDVWTMEAKFGSFGTVSVPATQGMPTVRVPLPPIETHLPLAVQVRVVVKRGDATVAEAVVIPRFVYRECSDDLRAEAANDALRRIMGGGGAGAGGGGGGAGGGSGGTWGRGGGGGGGGDGGSGFGDGFGGGGGRDSMFGSRFSAGPGGEGVTGARPFGAADVAARALLGRSLLRALHQADIASRVLSNSVSASVDAAGAADGRADAAGNGALTDSKWPDARMRWLRAEVKSRRKWFDELAAATVAVCDADEQARFVSGPGSAATPSYARGASLDTSTHTAVGLEQVRLLDDSGGGDNDGDGSDRRGRRSGSSSGHRNRRSFVDLLDDETRDEGPLATVYAVLGPHEGMSNPLWRKMRPKVTVILPWVLLFFQLMAIIGTIEDIVWSLGAANGDLDEHNSTHGEPLHTSAEPTSASSQIRQHLRDEKHTWAERAEPYRPGGYYLTLQKCMELFLGLVWWSDLTQAHRLLTGRTISLRKMWLSHRRQFAEWTRRQAAAGHRHQDDTHWEPVSDLSAFGDVALRLPWLFFGRAFMTLLHTYDPVFSHSTRMVVSSLFARLVFRFLFVWAAVATRVSCSRQSQRLAYGLGTNRGDTVDTDTPAGPLTMPSKWSLFLTSVQTQLLWFPMLSPNRVTRFVSKTLARCSPRAAHAYLRRVTLGDDLGVTTISARYLGNLVNDIVFVIVAATLAEVLQGVITPEDMSNEGRAIAAFMAICSATYTRSTTVIEQGYKARMKAGRGIASGLADREQSEGRHVVAGADDADDDDDRHDIEAAGAGTALAGVRAAGRGVLPSTVVSVPSAVS